MDDIVFNQNFFDFNEWLDEDLSYHKINYGGDSKLDEIQEAIIKIQSSAYACAFASSFNYKTYKMQEVILKNKDLKYIVLFARYVKGADIKALQKIILNSPLKNRIKYLCEFARFVPGADIKKIEKIVVHITAQNKNLAQAAYLFLKEIKSGALKKIILSFGKSHQLYWLAQQTSSRKDIAYIEKLLIKQKNFTHIRLMAQHIKLANIPKLEQFVLESGNVKEIRRFAKAVKDSKSRHFAILF